VVLDSAAAVAAGLTATANATLKGLDGRGTRAAIAQLDSIGIGDQVMTGIGCRIGALHAFRTLRDRQSLALLGNEAIARFEQTTIDFDARTIRFAGPRGRP
jgi:hypothetical protein